MEYNGGTVREEREGLCVLEEKGALRCNMGGVRRGLQKRLGVRLGAREVFLEYEVHIKSLYNGHRRAKTSIFIENVTESEYSSIYTPHLSSAHRVNLLQRDL